MPKQSLDISADLSLPLNITGKKIAFLGTTGSGKSYGAMKLAEEMLGAGAQIIALDPVGIWHGLRISSDGGGAGFPIPIFGGLHGDVPMEPTAGALIADIIADKRISAVIDISQMDSDAEAGRFATAFIKRLYERRKAQPAATFVFLEECQEFIPENPVSQTEVLCLHAFKRAGKIGRNFGIGFGLISQRPQEISKKVLNLSECVFAFQMNGKTEKDAIKAWLKSAGTEDVDADALPLLEVGHAHVWSPRWLKVSKEIKFSKKTTFDTSGTPELDGGQIVQVKPLKASELAAIKASMEETVKRAKAEDQKELRKRIAELEAAPRETVQGPAPPPQVVEVEVAVLTDQQITRLEALAEKSIKRGQLLVSLGNEIVQSIRLAFSKPAQIAPPVVESVAPKTEWKVRESPQPAAKHSGELTCKQQEILNRLAELSSIKISKPPRIMVAMMVGYTNVQSPGFRDAVKGLLHKSMVEFPDGDRLRITPAGMGLAAAVRSPTTVEQFQHMLIVMLGGTCAKIIPHLISEFPRPMSRIKLAGWCNYTNVQSPGFRDSIKRLRELGFAEYPSGDEIVGTPLLFMKES